MKFEFTKNGKALDMQGWSMSHDSNESTAYAPIHFDGEAVAVVMIKGDETVGRLISIGQKLVDRANSHDQLVAALKEVTEVLDKFGDLSDEKMCPDAWESSNAWAKVKAAYATLAAVGA